MGLFVHEYFSSGAYSGDLRASSLAPEGLAMLGAILQDFAACSGSRVTSTLDRRLEADARKSDLAAWADIRWADSPNHESSLFREFAAQAEATFVIAPESDGILLARRQLVERAGGRFLGHSAGAIQLCSDKLAFCEHLTRHDLPTVPTELFDHYVNESTFKFPIVIKPRDGAGSQDMFTIRGADQFETLREILSTTFGGREAIVQPFVAGRSLSVAAIVDGDTGAVEVFPAGEQHLSDDGRFHYQGGKLPADLPENADISGLVKRVCRSISGLAGYIGFDLILAADSSRVLVVEANSRLTTSYLGYRALANENLAARILQPGGTHRPIAWNSDCVEFRPDGRLRVGG